jgi:hypothetical protein
MTVLLIERTLPNIMHSIFKWTQEIRYGVGSGEGTLKDFFGQGSHGEPGLVFQVGYPDDLVKLVGPTLALAGPLHVDEGEQLYGDPLSPTEMIVDLNWFGFVLKRGSDQQNKVFRDRLMNDIYMLYAHVASSEGIPLYDAETHEEVGAIEVTNARARTVPVNAIDVEADRYKWVLDFTVAHSG